MQKKYRVFCILISVLALSGCVRVPSYTLSFDANGGEGRMRAMRMTDGERFSLEANAYTRADMVFAGWASVEGGRVDYADGEMYEAEAADATLHAVWAEPTQGLSFALINGDTEYEVSKGESEPEGTLVIPEYYGNLKVTAVAEYAFNDCAMLTGVIMPSGVTTIGSLAFGSCGRLAFADFPSGLAQIGDSAFCGCYALTNVSIPSRVSSIGANAFECCRLRTLVLPANLASVGIYAFYGCDRLKRIVCLAKKPPVAFDETFESCSGLALVEVPSGSVDAYRSAPGWCALKEAVTAIKAPDAADPGTYLTYMPSNDGTGYSVARGRYAPSGDLVIPDTYQGLKVTAVADFAFEDCGRLRSVTLPADIATIGESAFAGCVRLERVDLPPKVVSIGPQAFEFCSSLTDVSLPDSVVSIGDYAFFYCYGLRTASLPAGIGSVPCGLFCDCEALESVAIPPSVTRIEDSAFNGCASLARVDLPAGLASIGYGAFSGCAGLTSVAIPSRVTVIGDSAFSWCSSLERVTLPSDLTAIGIDSFRDCIALRAVAVPPRVKSIGGFAFGNCASLSRVTLPSGLSEIADDAFANCPSLNGMKRSPDPGPLVEETVEALNEAMRNMDTGDGTR